MKKLTVKEERYAQKVALSGDKTASYEQVYSCARMKHRTIVEEACRVAKKPHVAARIAELEAEIAAVAKERFKVDAAYVLQRLIEIDQMDVADILDDSGQLLAICNWPKCWRQTISGIDATQIMEDDRAALLKKIKWPDKVKNLELLGKHVEVQAFKEKQEQHVTGGTDNKYIIEVVSAQASDT